MFIHGVNHEDPLWFTISIDDYAMLPHPNDANDDLNLVDTHLFGTFLHGLPFNHDDGDVIVLAS